MFLSSTAIRHFNYDAKEKLEKRQSNPKMGKRGLLMRVEHHFGPVENAFSIEIVPHYNKSR